MRNSEESNPFGAFSDITRQPVMNKPGAALWLLCNKCSVVNK